MSDIVERLRAVAAMDLRTGGFLPYTLDTAKEAADEIERLRRDHIGAHRISGDTIRTLEAEIERLRAAKRRALQVADLRSKENVELRAALQRIVDEAESDDGLTAWDGGDIAREALAVEQTVPEFPVATEEDRRIYDRCREISEQTGTRTIEEVQSQWRCDGCGKLFADCNC